jgi:nitrate/nitrite-specific signal transduction histidine kinase
MNENYINHLQEQIKEKFINLRLKPEKDEDNQVIYSSLESIIDNIINNYLKNKYDSYDDLSEDNQKAYNVIYDKLFKDLSNKLDEKELLENMSIGQDWYGLTDAERNSGRY